jgi:hypothetical protein
MKLMRSVPVLGTLVLLALMLVLFQTVIGSGIARADGGGSGTKLFITSAVEHPDGTVTLPLHQGLSHGQAVYYIITDASDSNDAALYGVNVSQKLANAANTAAVQKVTVDAKGVVTFPATVKFGQQRILVPGPTGFPPAQAQPGAVGETGYSPLIQLPSGAILEASQVANASGQADKVVSLDKTNLKVTFRETAGFQGGKALKYVSNDASDSTAAAIEDVTYAPALNNAPTLNDDSTASSRASLAAFTNGQTGVNNPQRQGLNSAILDGLSPLNVLRWNPSQGRYSPLWDVHLTQWSQSAVQNGQNLRQTDFGTIQNLAEQGLVTGFGGGPFTASGFIVVCPIVSQQS